MAKEMEIDDSVEEFKNMIFQNKIKDYKHSFPNRTNAGSLTLQKKKLTLKTSITQDTLIQRSEI